MNKSSIPKESEMLNSINFQTFVFQDKGYIKFLLS